MYTNGAISSIYYQTTFMYQREEYNSNLYTKLGVIYTTDY